MISDQAKVIAAATTTAAIALVYLTAKPRMPDKLTRAIQVLDTVDLRGQGKVAVVVGGTTGIGWCLAAQLAAKGIDRIVILGRSESGAARTKAFIERESKGVTVDFVKADVSTVAGMRHAVDATMELTGEGGVDHLIMCQNGIPSGVIIETEDGHERGFAVQTLSRFAIAYLFTIKDGLRKGARVITVANTGVNLANLEVDDLSLKRRAAKGRAKAGLFMDQSFRDSSVLDAFHWELNERFPDFQYYNLHPGLVKSESFDNFKPGDLPFPIGYLMLSGLWTVGQQPQAYAKVPAFVALCPEAQRKDLIGSRRNFGHKLQPVKQGSWAQSASNRAAVFDKLKEMIGE